MPKGWATPGTATLIRDFLVEAGEAYPKQVHRHLKDEIEGMGFKPPAYDSVRKMIYALHRLGLIKRVRKQTVRKNPTAFKRVYYAVVRARLEDPAWENPTTAAFDPEKFERQRLWPKPKPEVWMEKIRRKRRLTQPTL